MSRIEEVYRPALIGKKIPALTLDNNWHQLFTQTETTPEIQKLEIKLNFLIKRQGKLTTESKDIKKIKTKLRREIVDVVDALNGIETNKGANKKLEDNKRLLSDCNEKLEAYQQELMDLPREIEAVNTELMLATMERCYIALQENSAEIEKIAEWIREIRIELKKNVIRKQESEIKNQQLYKYMHNFFGAEVIEIFDMKYNPAEKPVTRKKDEDASKK